MLCPLVDWQLESLYFYIHETCLHVLHRHCIGYFTYIWNQEKKRICQQIFIDINDGFTFIFNMSGWITVHYKYNASPKEEPHWLIIKRTKSFKKKMKATNCKMYLNGEHRCVRERWGGWVWVMGQCRSSTILANIYFLWLLLLLLYFGRKSITQLCQSMRIRPCLKATSSI